MQMSQKINFNFLLWSQSGGQKKSNLSGAFWNTEWSEILRFCNNSFCTLQGPTTHTYILWRSSWTEKNAEKHYRIICFIWWSAYRSQYDAVANKLISFSALCRTQ